MQPAFGRVPGEEERRLLDPGPLHAEHPGQLAGVRREHRRYAERAGDFRQRIRVHYDGHAIGDRPLQRLTSTGTTAGADHPGLHLSGADHDLRVGSEHQLSSPIAADRGITHHARQPAVGPRHGQQSRARIGVRTRGHAHHTSGVLCACGSGSGNSAAMLAGCNARSVGSGSVRPMSSNSIAPHANAAGSTRWQGLRLPKLTVSAAVT